MDPSIPVHTISLPEYRVEHKPNYQVVGRKLDAIVQKHFAAKNIAIRAISLADHPALSRHELVSLITELGTDKYDPQRKGVLHDFYAPFQIDLHALPCTVLENALVSSHCKGSSVMGECVAARASKPNSSGGTYSTH